MPRKSFPDHLSTCGRGGLGTILLAWWCSPIGNAPNNCRMHVSYWHELEVSFRVFVCTLSQRGIFFTPPHPPIPSQDMLDSLSTVYASLKEEDLLVLQCKPQLPLSQHSQGSVYCIHCALYNIHTVGNPEQTANQ